MRIAQITGDSALEEKADILCRVFSDKIKSNPDAFTQLMVAADFAVGPTYSVVVAGKKGKGDTHKIIEAINDQFIPNKVLIQRDTEQIPPDIDQISNFVQYFDDQNGKATAYICINKTCKPATQDITKIIKYLKSEW